MTSEKIKNSAGILLTGLDGSNPLAFLATIGTISVVSRKLEAKVFWSLRENCWMPVIQSSVTTADALNAQICDCLASDLGVPWDTNKRLPFNATEFRCAMLKAVLGTSDINRQTLDIFAAFGSESVVDDGGNFQDTAFRMVRSGDAAKCGMPDYARKNAARCNDVDIFAALFGPWTFAPKLSLRWDPNENREYAYQAANPSNESTVSAVGANRLAIEALALYPTMPGPRGLDTVGFTKASRGKDAEFRWPIWDAPLTLDAIRSLLTCPLLFAGDNMTQQLRAMGVAAVFGSRQIKPNQYYRNFSPSYQV